MTLFGIPIRIHPTFLFLLVAFALFGGLNAVALVCLVFTFVVLHEVSHSLMARVFGIRVLDITLLPIGGMARLSHVPEWPPAEFLIALAGPVFNFVVVALAGVLWVATRPFGFETLSWLLTLIIQVNAVLGLFNLLPAFPMDGGRLYRSWLAARHGFVVATQRAARLGRIIALGLVGLFIVQLVVHLSGDPVGWNPWLLAIAAFVWFSGKQEEMAAIARHRARAGAGVPPLWQLLGAAHAAMSARADPRGPAASDTSPASDAEAYGEDVIDVEGAVRQTEPPSAAPPAPNEAADAFRQLSEQAQSYLNR
jgi:stage IV sporulation protein FB